jgi:ParB family chromosome partitioning protein
MGHARALINVETIDAQLGIFQEIIEEDLSVRSVEALVRALSHDKSRKISQKKKIEAGLEGAMKVSGEKLATRLGTQVKIQVSTKERGEIKIIFANSRDLNRILKLLAVD